MNGPVPVPGGRQHGGRNGWATVLLLALCGLLAASCQVGVAQPSPTVAAPPRTGPGLFTNPVLDANFPDPDVLRTGEAYYVFATNGGGANVQVARSTDLVHWERLPDALPALPAWATAGHTWAPEVWAVDSGYALYFTARHTASGRQCIGVATSTAPTGSFTAQDTAPLICQLDQGGSIDASSFVDDDGQRYLLWKNDGNCCASATWLYLQPVSRDGLTLSGTPQRLVTADQPWEGFLVEAPTLWKHAGRYYLLYSANRYSGGEYAIGYAVADAITGPYRKPAGPLLTTRSGDQPVIGPGGQDVVTDPTGATWLLYHAWDPSLSYRRLYLTQLVWEGDRLVVKFPGSNP